MWAGPRAVGPSTALPKPCRVRAGTTRGFSRVDTPLLAQPQSGLCRHGTTQLTPLPVPRQSRKAPCEFHIFFFFLIYALLSAELKCLWPSVSLIGIVSNTKVRTAFDLIKIHPDEASCRRVEFGLHAFTVNIEIV